MPKVFYVYYFLVFTAVACNNLVSLYFREAGMTDSQMGLLFGLAPLTGLVAQPLMGTIADRSKYKNYVLYIILVCNIIAILLLRSARALLLMAVIQIFFTAINNCLIPVQDTITLDYCHKIGGEFAPIRLSGTIGYIVMAAITGYIMTGSAGNLLYVYIVLFALTLAAATRLPKAPGYRRKGEKHNVLGILKVRETRLILFSIFFLYSCMGFNYTFQPPYITQYGGTAAHMGIALAVSSITELPFFTPWGRRWIRKMGIGRLLIVCNVMMAVRWSLMAAFPIPWVIILANALHGLSVVVGTVGVVQYINDRVPPALKASGQMALTLFSVVLARCIGNMAGGALADLFNSMGIEGVRMVYLLMVPLSVVVFFVWMLPLLKVSRKQEEEEHPAAADPS
ncbi:MAG: MFS transporter [Christensenellales bacterium]